MAVTVVTLRNNEGGIYSKDVYEKGKHLQVNATGHLLVLSPANEILGIYAGSEWKSAYRDEEAAVDAR